MKNVGTIVALLAIGLLLGVIVQSQCPNNLDSPRVRRAKQLDAIERAQSQYAQDMESLLTKEAQ